MLDPWEEIPPALRDTQSATPQERQLHLGRANIYPIRINRHRCLTTSTRPAGGPLPPARDQPPAAPPAFIIQHRQCCSSQSPIAGFQGRAHTCFHGAFQTCFAMLQPCIDKGDLRYLFVLVSMKLLTDIRSGYLLLSSPSPLPSKVAGCRNTEPATPIRRQARP